MTTVKGQGERFHPEEISAMILVEIKEAAEAYVAKGTSSARILARLVR